MKLGQPLRLVLETARGWRFATLHAQVATTS
jgi:hypothetical protein